MSLILCIDTAVQRASIAISKEGKIFSASNDSILDHASWLHHAIEEILKQASIAPSELKAIAVSAGPGSYTGLRVGLSSAKGLCYALNKPLILISTLRLMASACTIIPEALRCPMIDARRMEVFTAIYNSEGDEILSPCNMILDQNSFIEFLDKNKIVFIGNGSNKFQTLTTHAHAIFPPADYSAVDMLSLAEICYSAQDFADLAYAEPFYVKEFYSPVK